VVEERPLEENINNGKVERSKRVECKCDEDLSDAIFWTGERIFQFET
jgi:hypothetical protein